MTMSVGSRPCPTAPYLYIGSVESVRLCPRIDACRGPPQALHASHSPTPQPPSFLKRSPPHGSHTQYLLRKRTLENKTGSTRNESITYMPTPSLLW
eukprot:gene10329-biopygen8657